MCRKKTRKIWHFSNCNTSPNQKPFSLSSEAGQGLMEYMILTGLIGILCLLTVRNFGDTIKSKMEQATSKINKSISIR